MPAAAAHGCAVPLLSSGRPQERVPAHLAAVYMHIADFLGYAAVHRGLADQLAAVAPFPDHPDARCLLLSGPERSGKTTLLFHAALSLARQGASVLLLCRRSAVLHCTARPTTGPPGESKCMVRGQGTSARLNVPCAAACPT